MPLKDVLDFMSQNKPEVIKAIIQGRHSNDGGLVIEPGTHAIDLSVRQNLNNDKPYTAVCEQCWHGHNRFRINHQSPKFWERAAELIR